MHIFSVKILNRTYLVEVTPDTGILSHLDKPVPKTQRQHLLRIVQDKLDAESPHVCTCGRHGLSAGIIRVSLASLAQRTAPVRRTYTCDACKAETTVKTPLVR